MKKGLEKFVSGMKNVGKKTLNNFKENFRVYTLLGAMAFGGNVINKVKADDKVNLNFAVDAGSASGSTIEYDEKVRIISNLEPQPPNIDSYLIEKESGNKLSVEGRGPDDFDVFYGELVTLNVNIGGSAWWKMNIIGDNSYLHRRNLFLKANLPDSSTEIAYFDIKKASLEPGPYGDGWFNFGTFNPKLNGVYCEFDVTPFNHADLNRDRKVDLQDWNIFAGNWKREGIEKGSNPNDPNDYADIANAYDTVDRHMVAYGNGSVGIEDLIEFAGEWGWKANDSNTW